MQHLNDSTLKELVQIGFLANIYGRSDDSEVIFRGLCAVAPDNADVRIGLAVALASNEQYRSAIELLNDDTLTVQPHANPAKCLLGWIYLRMGNIPYGKQVLHDVECNAINEDDAKLAQSLLASGAMQ